MDSAQSADKMFPISLWVLCARLVQERWLWIDGTSELSEPGGCCASVLSSVPKPAHPLLWVRREYSQGKWVHTIYKLSPVWLASRTILCPSSSSHTQPSYHALYREGGVWSPSPNPPDITKEGGNYSPELCWSRLSSLGRPLTHHTKLTNTQ